MLRRSASDALAEATSKKKKKKKTESEKCNNYVN
jgi:hypothetical protein